MEEESSRGPTHTRCSFLERESRDDGSGGQVAERHSRLHRLTTSSSSRPLGHCAGVRAFAQALVGAAAVVALAGCGSSPRDAAAVAKCLNGRGFLVQATGARIDGTSPGGIGLTLTVRSDRPSVLDTSGSPGNATLSRAAHEIVRSCTEKHAPRPGTLTAPAAR